MHIHTELFVYRDGQSAADNILMCILIQPQLYHMSRQHDSGNLELSVAISIITTLCSFMYSLDHKLSLVSLMLLKYCPYVLEQCSRILAIMLNLCSICKALCSTNSAFYFSCLTQKQNPEYQQSFQFLYSPAHN